MLVLEVLADQEGVKCVKPREGLQLIYLEGNPLFQEWHTRLKCGSEKKGVITEERVPFPALVSSSLIVLCSVTIRRRVSEP